MNSLPNNDKITVLVVGANGVLGSKITKQLLQTPNILVSILVRDRQKIKDLADQVEKAGGKVIIGDVEKPETLVGVTQGIHTVVSTINNFSKPTLYSDAQINLLNEAVKNGVQRFVPAEFASDLHKFTREELALFPHAEEKMKFEDYIKTLPIKTLHFQTGSFLDFYFENIKDLAYWGDNADRKFEFVACEDLAKFVAVIIADKDKTGTFTFVSETLSLNELSAVYNKVRGTNVSPKRLGSLAEVRQQYDEKKKAGDHMGALFAGLAFVRNDPRNIFEKTDNADFPEVKATSVEDFLKNHPEAKIM